MTSRAEGLAATQATTTSASSFRERWQNALRARARVIARFDDARIVAALASATSEWTDPRSELRRRTAVDLAAATTLHPDMLATGLEFVFGAVTVESLQDLLVREAGSAGRRGPESVFYSLAGNVPGQAIPPIVASLLARSVAVIRDSARQPLLTEAFRQSIARIEPELAAMIVPVGWSSTHPTGDETELERLVVRSVGRIEVFGSDETVSSLTARYATTASHRVARHATRLSAGIVASTADLDAAAGAFAIDVVMYEGRGCLTPHTLLVEGPPARATDFADRLARSLEELQRKWPRARGSLAEESTRRGWIDRAEMAALAEPTTSGCRIGHDVSWCVRTGTDERLTLGPGLRCASVITTRDRSATIVALSSASTPLAAIGVAAADDVRSLADLASTLRPRGVTLVCPAGRMQAPPIDWEQDGRRRLSDLLESKT